MTESEARALTLDGELPDLDVLQEVFQRVRNNRLYGQKLDGLSLESWDDFFRLPLTTKQELRACAPTDTLAVPIEEVWHYHESFGTTGQPLATWFTRDDYEREVDLTQRWTVPIKPGARVLNRLPYSFAVPPFVVEMKARREGGVVIPADNLNWNVSYARTLDIIRRTHADVIVCFPLEVIVLDLLAERCGYDRQRDLGSLKHIMLAGRGVPPALRDHIERRWSASTTCVYGLTETGGMASMCKSWRSHVHPGAFVLELVDPETGKHVSKGEVGVLVTTSYYRRAAPLIHYNTRDYCRAYPDPCPCGDPSPTIEILGRMDDTVELAGQRLYFARLEQAILEFAREFDTVIYFVVVKKRLRIRVESENGRRRPSREAMQKLRDTLGVPLKVSVCKKGELLDLNSMLRFPNVFKPHNVSDWRQDRRRCVTLSEALIEWPDVGLGDLADILRRALKNALLRKTLR